jgi:hypothetical protein
MLSKNPNSFLRTVKNKDFKGNQVHKNRVLLHRQVHDPGIQYEPLMRRSVDEKD